MIRKLYIYCIHTTSLSNRAIRSHGVINEFTKAAKEKGFEVYPILILKPDVDDLQPNLNDLQSKVKKELSGDSDFDDHISNFNIQMISNFQKHKEAWKRIYSQEENNDSESYYLVMEDDTFIINDSIKYFKNLLDIINTKSFKWNMIFLGVPMPSDYSNDNNFNLININDNIKILPSKEAYFITQRTARRIYDSLDYYTFILRVQLSYLFYTNKNEYNIYYTNKRITIDGSKVGVFPSSIHETNHLIYNNEYMNLYSYYFKEPDEILKNYQEIFKIYKQVESLNNLDINVLFSKILIKINKLSEAKIILNNTFLNAKESNALLNSRSDIINMIIDISSNTQDDLESLLKAKSKFSSIPLLDN